MSFMQKQIEFGTYFQVDTTAGIEIVPTDVIGRTMDVHVDALLDYLEGKPLDEEETCEVKSAWLVRWHAPGYMDCTPWTAFTCEAKARAYLEDDQDSDYDSEMNG